MQLKLCRYSYKLTDSLLCLKLTSLHYRQFWISQTVVLPIVSEEEMKEAFPEHSFTDMLLNDTPVFIKLMLSKLVSIMHVYKFPTNSWSNTINTHNYGPH